MTREEIHAELTRLQANIPTATILAQLQARRVVKLQALLAQLAEEATGGASAADAPRNPGEHG